MPEPKPITFDPQKTDFNLKELKRTNVADAHKLNYEAIHDCLSARVMNQMALVAQGSLPTELGASVKQLFDENGSSCGVLLAYHANPDWEENNLRPASFNKLFATEPEVVSPMSPEGLVGSSDGSGSPGGSDSVGSTTSSGRQTTEPDRYIHAEHNAEHRDLLLAGVPTHEIPAAIHDEILDDATITDEGSVSDSDSITSRGSKRPIAPVRDRPKKRPKPETPYLKSKREMRARLQVAQSLGAVRYDPDASLTLSPDVLAAIGGSSKGLFVEPTDSVEGNRAHLHTLREAEKGLRKRVWLTECYKGIHVAKMLETMAANQPRFKRYLSKKDDNGEFMSEMARGPLASLWEIINREIWTLEGRDRMNFNCLLHETKPKAFNAIGGAMEAMGISMPSYLKNERDFTSKVQKFIRQHLMAGIVLRKYPQAISYLVLHLEGEDSDHLTWEDTFGGTNGLLCRDFAKAQFGQNQIEEV